MTHTKVKDYIELKNGSILVEVPTGTKKRHTRTRLQKFFNVYISEEFVTTGRIAAVCDFTREYDDETDRRVLVPYTKYSVGDKVHILTYCSGEEVFVIDGSEYTVVNDNAIQFKYKQQG